MNHCETADFANTAMQRYTQSSGTFNPMSERRVDSNPYGSQGRSSAAYNSDQNILGYLKPAPSTTRDQEHAMNRINSNSNTIQSVEENHQEKYYQDYPKYSQTWSISNPMNTQKTRKDSLDEEDPQNNHFANLSQIIIEDSQEDVYTRYTGYTHQSIDQNQLHTAHKIIHANHRRSEISSLEHEDQSDLTIHDQTAHYLAHMDHRNHQVRRSSGALSHRTGDFDQPSHLKIQDKSSSNIIEGRRLQVSDNCRDSLNTASYYQMSSNFGQRKQPKEDDFGSSCASPKEEAEKFEFNKIWKESRESLPMLSEAIGKAKISQSSMAPRIIDEKARQMMKEAKEHQYTGNEYLIPLQMKQPQVSTESKNEKSLEQKNKELEQKLNELESQLRVSAMSSNEVASQRVSQYAQKFEKERSTSPYYMVDSLQQSKIQPHCQNSETGSLLIDGLNTQGMKDKFGVTIGSSIPDSKTRQSGSLEKCENMNTIRLGVNLAQNQQESLGQNSFRDQRLNYKFVPRQLHQSCSGSPESRTRSNLSKAAEIRNFVNNNILKKSYDSQLCVSQSESTSFIANDKINIKELKDRQEKTESLLQKSRGISGSRRYDRPQDQSVNESRRPTSYERAHDQSANESRLPQSYERAHDQSANESRRRISYERAHDQSANESRLPQSYERAHDQSANESRRRISYERAHDQSANESRRCISYDRPHDHSVNESIRPQSYEIPHEEPRIIEGKHSELPFSLAESQTAPRKQYISNVSSTPTELPELLQAKSAFQDMFAQNKDLEQKLVFMEQKFAKIEEEKKQAMELNDLKMQQFESKIKLIEMQSQKEIKRKQNEEERIKGLENEIQQLHQFYQKKIEQQKSQAQQTSQTEARTKSQMESQNPKKASIGYSDQTFDPKESCLYQVETFNVSHHQSQHSSISKPGTSQPTTQRSTTQRSTQQDPSEHEYIPMNLISYDLIAPKQNQLNQYESTIRSGLTSHSQGISNYRRKASIEETSDRPNLAMGLNTLQMEYGLPGSQHLTFGEKQRLFEHISLLETIQTDANQKLQRLITENQILNRFRYTQISQPLEKILPKCYENEVFIQWSKFTNTLNRTLKKCFQNGQVFKQGFSKTFKIDNELLIRYIEKLVQNLQTIEKLVIKLYPESSPSFQQLRDQNIQIIELISESSLSLSQMPELYNGQENENAFMKVYQNICYWKEMVTMHMEYMVSEVVNQNSEKNKEEKTERSNDQDDLDEFWSDFSDNDYNCDQMQEKDEIDILYNLQSWIKSNKDIDFYRIFRPFQVPNTFLVTLSSFIQVLEQCGYDYCQISQKHQTDFMCLVRAISCTQVQSILTNKNVSKCWQKTPIGFINYKQFLDDLAEKPFKWWEEIIKQFLLEIQDQDVGPQKLDQFQSENKISNYFPKAGSDYETFCQKIIYRRTQTQTFEIIFDSGKQHITKSSLRKYLLQNSVFSRLDCHILILTLFNQNKNIIKSEKNPEIRKYLKENIDKIGIKQLKDLVKKANVEKYEQRCNI